MNIDTSQMSVDNRNLLNKILEGLEHEDRSFYDSLSDQEVHYVLQILREYTDGVDSPTRKLMWEIDYEERPVDINTFLTDKNYLGDIGDTLYDTWREELHIVCDEYSRISEWLIGGGIGLGKSTVGFISNAYKLYRLCCLRNPVKFYELSDHTFISIALFNITKELAYKVNYKNFMSILNTSPWFSQYYTNVRGKSTLVLPKNIELVVGSNSLHVLGQNVTGGIMDETDFNTTGGEHIASRETYNAIHRRIVSRFGDFVRSSPPGLLCLISSTTQSENSFMNERIRLSEEFPESTHISRFALWEVKKHIVAYQGSRFPVFLGDDMRAPTVLDIQDLNLTTVNNIGETIKVYDSDNIIWVPEYFRKEFNDDPEQSILDLAGERIGSRQHKFLHNKKFLHDCIFNRKVHHPFTRDRLMITIDNNNTIDSFLQYNLLFVKTRYGSHKSRMIVNPKAPRFIHVDLAKNGDSCGIACVHKFGHKEIVRKNLETNNDDRTLLPYVYVDFMIEIFSDKKSEIDFSKIRDFISYLISCGMVIHGLSYDSYQSTDSMQHFKKQKIIPEVDTISMDRTPEPYNQLRSLIVENRINTYYLEKFFNEVFGLERDPKTKKIDHPPGGSKDISDSVAGATFNCLRFSDIMSQFLPPLLLTGADVALSNGYLTKPQLLDNTILSPEINI